MVFSYEDECFYTVAQWNSHTKLHLTSPLVFYGEMHIQGEMENRFPVLSSWPLILPKYDTLSILSLKAKESIEHLLLRMCYSAKYNSRVFKH